jgi:hypothetical protein
MARISGGYSQIAEGAIVATYKDGKLVSGKKIGLTINAFIKDEEINEVTTGSHLGEAALIKDPEGNVYGGVLHFRPGSTVPLTFRVKKFGDETIVEAVGPGMHNVDTAKFDALAYLDKHDDAEKLDVLTDAEKAELSSITYEELKTITLESHAHEPPTTAKEEAAIAIIQHEGLPKPGEAHNIASAPGPLANIDVLLTVGSHQFTQKTPGFEARREVCKDGRTLYQYNWTGVALSVLDEPAD